MEQEMSLRRLKGVGEKTEQLFGKLGIHSVDALLQYYPRSYDVCQPPCEIADLQSGYVAAVQGTVTGSVGIRNAKGKTIITTKITGGSNQLSLVWFNMPFLKNTLRRGAVFVFRGKVISHKGMFQMEQPKIYTPAQYEEVTHTLQPIYGLTAGLTNNAVIKAMKQALMEKRLYREYLPEDFRKAYQLADYNYAVENIHFPRKTEDYITARKRLAFDEFLLFILAIRQLKEQNEVAENHFPMKRVWDTEEIIENLPYQLTGAQLRVWTEIETDMQGRQLMARLIQGDVGSGKTILAFLAMVMAARNGYQAAIMVPTEVLAVQHYEDLCRLLAENKITDCRPVLLTGSVSGKARRDIYETIASGEANLVVGTHALIQENVRWKNLALAVTDEQHRFGVAQRETLAGQGNPPNVIVMSATPIPRTLAIILFGDLDISVIDELPARRLPIKNCVVGPSYRNTAYKFMMKEVQSGHQVYVICPMVEESEGMDGENVLDYTRRLKEILPPELVITCLHGKMKNQQKNEIMRAFAEGEIHILVSTTVIEVGVNVPNATVMMVENAERFGLAQLHQLRGRVGRGDAQSYCIFINGKEGEDTSRRLDILTKSNDGFYIAGEDLKLRGPGDLFGIRQSGLMEFSVGDIYQDADILQMASEAADRIAMLMYENHCEDFLELEGKLRNYMGKKPEIISL